MDIAAGEIARLDRLLRPDLRSVRAGEVRRAADQFRHDSRDRLKARFIRLPRGELWLFGKPFRLELRNRFGQCVRQCPCDCAIKFATLFGGKRHMGCTPLRVRRLASVSCCAPCVENSLRQFEGRIAPMEMRARCFDFGCTQGRTVSRRGTLLVRRAIADQRSASNQRWPVALFRGCYGASDLRHIVAVNAADSPACRLKAL